MVNAFKEDITLWSRGAGDGYGGYTYSAPQPLKGRWEDRQELFINAQREEELSRAIVFLPSSYTIDPGDYLVLGASVVGDPTSVEGSFEVRLVLRTPDLRNVRTELRVVL